MKIRFELDGQSYDCDTENGVSLGISVDFEGSQPNHFGAPKANRAPLKLNGFVGDTQQGGSCNVDTIELVPHCNGTHTETVGHIVDDEVAIGLQHINSINTATLIHVEPESVAEIKARGESYRPPLDDVDQVICAAQLEFALHSIDLPLTDSLIVVTSSSDDKKSAEYTQENQPPFFTVEAMELIVARGFKHILVDFPSVDRMYDDGLLTNHHLFWNVEETTHELTDQVWTEKTITEMIFVPAEIESGFYLLNMQLPGWRADAAPSRPILFKPTKVGS